MDLSIFAAVFSLFAFCAGNTNPDLVKSLPGLQSKVNFKHYSGYLDAGDKIYLHYWFFESENSPAQDPVVLWMNGGPGCSSLLGALDELGPFRVNPDGQYLTINKYAWNKVANVLFLETPAGVGFSYSEHTIERLDDDIVARYNYNALQSFFSKFPQFQKNEFYASGESYAGVYVPTLAVLLLNNASRINFKGFMIGNGYLDSAMVANSVPFFLYYHGLVGSSQWNKLSKLCCEKGLATERTCNFVSSNAACQEMANDLEQAIQLNGLNMYNIYADCVGYSWPLMSRDKVDMINLFEQFSLLNRSNIHISAPCVDENPVLKYLLRGTVRSALNIPENAPIWEPCSKLPYWQKHHVTMKKEVIQLLSSGRVRGLIYNGDVDMVCSFLSNMWFVDDLGIPVVQEFGVWKVDSQIAGSVKYYKNLIFATVKGAGHMVPKDKPELCLKMIYSFLFKKSH